MSERGVVPPGLVELTGVRASYGAAPVLLGVTLRFSPGCVTGVIGPNGAGKSTLLKAILGLVPIDAGTIFVVGTEPTASPRRLAYLPQRAAIAWDYPAQVGEVVAMGCYPRRGRAVRAVIAEALALVELDDLADRAFGTLSGGQQQRVLFARALAQQAPVLLLDEPFAGVGAVAEQLLRHEVRRLAESGSTLVVVNHDLASVTDCVR